MKEIEDQLRERECTAGDHKRGNDRGSDKEGDMIV